jgi:hypothetical protein
MWLSTGLLQGRGSENGGERSKESRSVTKHGQYSISRLVVFKQVVLIRDFFHVTFFAVCAKQVYCILKTVLVWHYYGIEKRDLYVVSSALRRLVGILQMVEVC